MGKGHVPIGQRGPGDKGKECSARIGAQGISTAHRHETSRMLSIGTAEEYSQLRAATAEPRALLAEARNGATACTRGKADGGRGGGGPAARPAQPVGLNSSIFLTSVSA